MHDWAIAAGSYIINQEISSTCGRTQGGGSIVDLTLTTSNLQHKLHGLPGNAGC